MSEIQSEVAHVAATVMAQTADASSIQTEIRDLDLSVLPEANKSKVSGIVIKT